MDYKVNFVLIGKTGNGKSATGKAILGRSAFRTSPSAASVTKSESSSYRGYEQHSRKEVDGPGLEDTDNGNAQKVGAQLKGMELAIALGYGGFRTFSLIQRFLTRFTNEDHTVYEICGRLFEHTYFQPMIVGDDFEEAMEENSSTLNFHECCQQQTSRRNREIVSELLANWDNVDVKDNFGNTPLHFRAEKNFREIISLLLSKNADVNAQNKHSRTLLHESCKHNDAETVSLLLTNKADANVRDKKGITPLHVSAQRGITQIASLLLEHKADVNTQKESGCTPLHLSAQHGNTEIVSLLLKYKANVNVQNESGRTPLHLSALRGHTKIVSLLLAYKADVNIQNESSRTPLHLSAQRGYTEIVSLLLKNKADFNVKDENGKTPLHFSAQRGHTEIVSLLLAYKADVNVKNNENLTPIDYAENKYIVNVLLQHGAVRNNLWSTCRKNPGHLSFIPVKDFTKSHLPANYQQDEFVEIIEALSGLTVKVSVHYVSEKRQTGDVFYSMRGKRFSRTGSGTVVNIEDIHTSSSSESVSVVDNQYIICIQTALHVVYDDSEVLKTTVDFFYDDEKDTKNIRRLKGSKMVDASEVRDYCLFECTTADAVLVKKLRECLQIIPSSPGLSYMVSGTPEECEATGIEVFVEYPDDTSGKSIIWQLDRPVVETKSWLLSEACINIPPDTLEMVLDLPGAETQVLRDNENIDYYWDDLIIATRVRFQNKGAVQK